MALNFPDNPGIGSVFVDTNSGFSFKWDGTVWNGFAGGSASQISNLDNIAGSFNGSTTTFALAKDSASVSPLKAEQLRVVLGGVTQTAGTDYTISGSNITFTTAPSAGLTCTITQLGIALSLSDPADDSVTPAKLSTGGPKWNSSGDFYISGIATANNGLVVGVGLTLADDVKINLGDNDDLQIVHDGSNSLIDGAGTGGVHLKSNTEIKFLKRTGSENILVGTADGSVAAFYDNTKRLETTTGGALVYGTVGAAQTALVVEGDIKATGVVTAVSFNGELVGAAVTTTSSGLHVVGVATVLNVNSTNVTAGVVTATTFNGALSGNATGLTGTPNIDCGTGSFTGDVDIADKIIHTGDTDTAIRFPAANTFTVETGGSEALRVDSSQRLLVGSTSARANFFDSSHSSNIQVEGNTTTKSSLAVIRNDNGDDGSRIFFAKSRGTGDTIVQDDDRLGAIEFQGNDGGGFVAAAHIASFVDGTPGSNDMPARLVFSTTADGASSPTERLRITSTARFGFNTAIPPRDYCFHSGQADTNIQITNNTTGVDDSAGALIQQDGNDLYIWNKENSFMSLGTNATEKVRIDSSGNIGVGLNASLAGFCVNNTIRSQNTSSNISYIGFTGYTGNTTVGTMFSYMGGDGRNTGYLNFSTNDTERLRIDSSGRLLINTTTSRIVEDHVGNGPQGFIQIEAADSSAIMSIISAGTADANRCGTISLGRHRNSTVGGTPTIVQDGDALGAVMFSAGDGTDMRTAGAKIHAEVDGTPGSNDMPGALVFSTTPDGSSTPGSSNERLRIGSNGVVTVARGAVAEIDTLTSASSVTPDFAASCNFTLTLGHNVTLENPSNLTAGQSGSIFLVQDGTGSRTITFGSQYDFAGGTAPTLSTAASSVDRLDYIVRTSSSIHCVVTLAYS